MKSRAPSYQENRPQFHNETKLLVEFFPSIFNGRFSLQLWSNYFVSIDFLCYYCHSYINPFTFNGWLAAP